MELKQLLQDFRAKSGLAPLNQDEELYRLVFDERWNVDIEDRPKDGPGFLLYAVAGTLPANSDPAVLRRFLSANLFARSANDAFVALNGDEIVILCRQNCTAMDLAAFEIALRDFVDQIEYWNEFLSQGETAPTTGNSAPIAEHFIRA
ncbi:MAG: CesT family type secretion system chaperone [Proteobacteria bacterium]|nr:CesT family type secretion system chaperone [Pseudomonadota bacterium]